MCALAIATEDLKDTQHRSGYPPGQLFPSNSTHSTTAAHQPPCKKGMQLSGCTTSQRKPISISFQGHLPFHSLRHLCTTSKQKIASEDDGHFMTDNKNLFTRLFWISLLQLTLISGRLARLWASTDILQMTIGTKAAGRKQSGFSGRILYSEWRRNTSSQVSYQIRFIYWKACQKKSMSLPGFLQCVISCRSATRYPEIKPHF